MRMWLRAGVAIAWAGALVLLASWSATNAALATGAVLTLLVGAAVGRWWVLLVPLLPAAVLVVGSVGDAAPDAHGTTGLWWAAYIAIVAAAIACVLAGAFLSLLAVLAARAGREAVSPPPVVPDQRIRPPLTYAGHGSLGGTSSTLRR